MFNLILLLKGVMGKGLRLLDDNMIKNIVDKSENLLKCFGYEVASNTVTQNTDLKNTVSIKTDFIKTDLNLETSTGTCNDKYDNKCEEITVQTISDTIIHDDNVHNEVGSTAVRTLNVLPLAAQSSIEWREIFLKLNCANKLIETDSLINQKSKIKSKSNNKNNNNDNSNNNNNCNKNNNCNNNDINDNDDKDDDNDNDSNNDRNYHTKNTYNMNNNHNNKNSNSNLLQCRIYELNELLHQLVSTDDERTGTISIKSFESILFFFHRLACNIPLSHYFRDSDDILKLLIEIKKRFRCGKNNEKISYIAIWGTVLSFLIQISGTENYRFENSEFEMSKNHNTDDRKDMINFSVNYFVTLPQLMLEAITTIERGLDELRASSLIKYLMSMQYVQDISLPFPLPFSSSLPSSLPSSSPFPSPSPSPFSPSLSPSPFSLSPFSRFSASVSLDFIPNKSSTLHPSTFSPFQTSSFSTSFQHMSLPTTSFTTSLIPPTSNHLDMSHIPLTGVWVPHAGTAKGNLIISKTIIPFLRAILLFMK